MICSSPHGTGSRQTQILKKVDPMPPITINDKFISDLTSGDKRTISRAISMVEDYDEGNIDLLKKIFKHTGKAHRIGITGPPGAGKSSITNALAKLLIDQGHKVGIIAVDPTSPFTGGALLGDRIRMQEIGLLARCFHPLYGYPRKPRRSE